MTGSGSWSCSGNPKPRSWEDIVVCGIKIYFRYRPKEIDCPTPGRQQEIIPWAQDHSRITYRLEFLYEIAYARNKKYATISSMIGNSHVLSGLQRVKEKLRSMISSYSFPLNKHHFIIKLSSIRPVIFIIIKKCP